MVTIPAVFARALKIQPGSIIEWHIKVIDGKLALLINEDNILAAR